MSTLMVEPNSRLIRWMTWSGLVCIVIIAGGMLLARQLPPPSATLSAEQIARRFAEHKNWIRLGGLLMIFGVALWACFVAVINLWIRRMERGAPILTYLSLILSAVGTFIFFLFPFLWVVAAFRPETISPDIIITLNDTAWLAFLWLATPFAFWWLLIAVAIFQDRNETRILPRWVAYLNIFLALDSLCGLTTAFLKSGPLSWTGVLSFWIPLSVTFVWIVGMTVTMDRALKERATQEWPIEEAERVLALAN